MRMINETVSVRGTFLERFFFLLLFSNNKKEEANVDIMMDDTGAEPVAE